MGFPLTGRLCKIFLAATFGLTAMNAGCYYAPKNLNHNPGQYIIPFPGHGGGESIRKPGDNPSSAYPENITSALEEAWNRIVTPPANWSGDLYFINPATNNLVRCARASAIGEKKGTVILTCGYNEFPELFYETIKDYQEKGLEVWTMDWHGFGRSGRDNLQEPQKTSLRPFDQHVSDLDYFIDKVVQPDQNLPLIYSANSMGGHFGMLYMEENPDKFDAAILATPMLDVSRRGLSKVLRPVLSGLFNALSYAGFENVDVPFSGMYRKKDPDHDGSLGLHDPNLTWDNLRTKAKDYQRTNTDNLMLGPPSIGWLKNAMESASKLLDENRLKAVQTYVLIGNAEKDNLVDVLANEFAVQHLPHAELIVPKDAAHGLWFLSGEGRREWIDAVDRVIEQALIRYRPANDNDNDNQADRNHQPPADSGPAMSYG